jgi:hypothetical protein
MFHRPEENKVSSSSNEVTAWFHRFWDMGEGDAETAVAAREHEFKFRLPEVLRAAYSETWLRTSQQLHLRALESLHLDGEVLVFADEQQHGFGWGFKSSDASEDNPKVWRCGAYALRGQSTYWEQENLSVAGILKLIFLINRPYESPRIDGVSPPGKTLIKLGWDEYVFPLSTGELSLWAKGSAVSDGISIGARSRTELNDVLRELKISYDEDDID